MISNARLLLSVIACVFALGCSNTQIGTDHALQDAPLPQVESVNDTPLLPLSLPDMYELDNSVARSVSIPHNLPYRGDNFIQSSSGVSTTGLDALIDAGSSATFEYALYEGNPLGEPLSLSASFLNEQGSGVYMAVADYGLGRWVFSGPHTSSVQRSLSGGDFTGPVSGRVFVVFCCAAGDSVVVDGWSLVEDLPAPQAGTIDSEGMTGLDSSMALINGLPSIAYYDFGNGGLRYVRAEDSGGGAWGSPKTLEPGTTGRFPSLATVDGKPAISYFDNGNEYLSFIAAKDAAGDEWEEAQDIDTNSICGEFSSLVVVDGFPAVSYQSYGTESLRYIRALDPAGASWGEPLDVDAIGSAESSVEGTSMLVVGGNPAIAYYSYSEAALKYVRATDASGTAWAQPLVVDSTDDAGRAPSMLLVQDAPAICYGRIESGSQHYVRAQDSLGSEWGEAVTLDSDGDCGYMNSMALIAFYPVAVSYDLENGRLRICQAVDFDGSSWAEAHTLDESGDRGAHPSLIELDPGVAGVSYADVSNGDLLFMLPFGG